MFVVLGDSPALLSNKKKIENNVLKLEINEEFIKEFNDNIKLDDLISNVEHFKGVLRKLK